MSREMGEDNSNSPWPKNDNYSQSPNDYLRTKMVFCLREELKSPFTISMEEISDLKRITKICKCTLKSMEETQEYRRYLYHPNNRVSAWHRLMRMYHYTISLFNISNNADFKKKQMAERVIGKSLSKQSSAVAVSENLDKRPKDLPKTSSHRYKIEGLQTAKTFDNIEDDPVSSGGLSFQNKSINGESSKDHLKPTRKDSMRPLDKYFAFPGGKKKLSTKGLLQIPDTDDKAESDTDLLIMGQSAHLTHRQQALKLLADIQQKMDKKKQSEDDDVESNSSRKSKGTITPQEALQCAWLRLSKTQIETLEELIRQQGKDPGVHAHSDVSNYDVFSEIREIRRRENAFKEEDEYK